MCINIYIYIYIYVCGQTWADLRRSSPALRRLCLLLHRGDALPIWRRLCSLELGDALPKGVRLSRCHLHGGRQLCLCRLMRCRLTLHRIQQ